MRVPDLLESARAGDEDAYRRLVEPHRRELHAHCYRMLGSVHDAEDARALPVEHGSAADPGDELGEPLADSLWLEPYPDADVGSAAASPAARYEQRESVELAFVAALQHLPGTQRAVLILRDVLGFSAKEVAASLETTVASANSALQRARKTVDERLPQQSQQATLHALGDERMRALVSAFVDAWERADVDAVLAMLAEDATFAMPPLPTWFRGHDAIRTFLSQRVFATPWRFLPFRASGQPAIACYQWDPDAGAYRLGALNVLTLRGPRIAAITAFLDPEVLVHFDLPGELPGDR